MSSVSASNEAEVYTYDEFQYSLTYNRGHPGRVSASSGISCSKYLKIMPLNILKVLKVDFRILFASASSNIGLDVIVY